MKTKMMFFYAIETVNTRVFCKDTQENWQETFEFLRSEGITYRVAKCSDYSGPTVESDQVYRIHHGSQNPAPAPHWLYYK
jgi:hypothetical protein